MTVFMCGSRLSIFTLELMDSSQLAK